MILTVDQTIGLNYPKYTTLHKANEIFKGSKADSINIYIDGYNIIQSLFSVNTRITDNLSVVSGIINLCSHLRSYYRNFYNVESKIFIIMFNGQANICEKLINGYNKSFQEAKANNRVMAKYIDANWHLLNELCKYLPDIFCVRTIMEPMVKIYDIIQKETETCGRKPQIVFSKDVTMLQLAAMHQDVVIFKLVKTNPEYIITITKQNAISAFANITRKAISDTTNAKLPLLNPELYSLVVTLTSLKNRNVQTLKTLNAAVSMLLELINDGKIQNKYCMDIEGLYDLLYPKLQNSIIKSRFINRFRALDLIWLYNMYTRCPEYSNMDYYVNLVDPDTVRDINNKYFINNPLDLERI